MTHHIKTDHINLPVGCGLWEKIERRYGSLSGRTSFFLARNLQVYLDMILIGEVSLHRKFTRNQARQLAQCLNRYRLADELSWYDFLSFDSHNLSAIVELFDPDCDIPIPIVLGLTKGECLALMEYASLIEEPEVFEAHTQKFRP